MTHHLISNYTCPFLLYTFFNLRPDSRIANLLRAIDAFLIQIATSSQTSLPSFMYPSSK